MENERLQAEENYEAEFKKIAREADLSYSVMFRYASVLLSVCRHYKVSARQYYFMYLIAKGKNSFSQLDIELAKQERKIIFNEKTYELPPLKIRSTLQELVNKEILEASNMKEYIALTYSGAKLTHDVTAMFISNLTLTLAEEGKLDEWTDILSMHPDIVNFEENGRIRLSLQDLPKHLLESMLVDGEKSYLRIIEMVTKTLINNGILQRRSGQKTLGVLSSAPIFFKYEPEIVKEQLSDFSKYYGAGMSVVSGWITSFSNVKSLDFGTLYNCEKGHYYLLFKTSKSTIRYCPKCSGELSSVVDMGIPSHQIVIETKDGSYIKAQIHPDLWNPGMSIAIKQNFMLIKLEKTVRRAKEITEDTYLVIGLDQEESIKVNREAAEKIAAHPTEKIIRMIRNSLYPRFYKTKPIEEASIISMASIGTKKIHLNTNKFKDELINGTINMLVWGIEGSAKSKICRILNELVSMRKAASSGFAGSTSIKGLTACYDKDLNAVKAGTIPLNDSFGVLIEELDKFDKVDMRDLLEPFEDKKITYSKAGKQNVFQANTVNMCTANNKKPIGGSEDAYDIINQLKTEISRPLIDRIDIIIAVTKTVPVSQMMADWLVAGKQEYLTKDQIRNFYLSAREIEHVHINPEQVKHTLEVIKRHHLNITPRRLNTIFRIAAAVAKLHLRDNITNVDLDEAYSYFLSFLETLGEIQVDVLQQLEQAGESVVLAEKLKSAFDSSREREVGELAMIYDISEEKVKIALDQLSKDGDVFTIDGNKWVKK